MSTGKPEWIVPASIPFDDLKARDLEECVYWLLDAMGAQDLEWRVGGAGGGAADGGRDLEAKILVPDEDGELRPQTWWFECKGRKGTVESSAVKNAAVNASAFIHVDAVVIVTNTTFSNPTIDWVKSWNTSCQKQQVQLWDKSRLEQLISRQPSVVLRLFSKSLSLAGRLEALRTRFWNRIEFSPAQVLNDIWESRSDLEIDPSARFALIANEFANKSIETRPWAADAPLEDLFGTLQMALANVLYLRLRILSSGVNQEPIFRAIVYVILMALQKTTVDRVSRMIEILTAEYEGLSSPDDAVEMVLGPILNHLQFELTEVCVPDCPRVSRFQSGKATSDGESLDTYWRRFDSAGFSKVDNRFFWLEHQATPCDIGFPVDDQHGCPLISDDVKVENLTRLLTVAQRVSKVRIARSQEKRRLDEQKSADKKG
ncbi:MAG: hypothetical protein JWQ10_1743 [Herbaspirillum sp.]|nr:hypothetical protein [Herbaspirillum sp.]